MDQGHKLLLMALQALKSIRPRKPTQLLTAWKISSHAARTAGGGYSSNSARSLRQQSPSKDKIMWLTEINKFLEIEKGLNWWHFPRRPIVHLTHLINHCLQLSHFPETWKEAKVMLPKLSRDPKLTRNLRPISLLSITGKLFEKAILKILKMHIKKEACLMQASWFPCTPPRCMRLTDHVALNVHNNMFMAAVFLNIEKAFDTTWHSGMLYKFHKLEFSTSLIQLISSFLPPCNFSVLVDREMSTPRKMQKGVPQGSVLSPTLYNIYINDAPKHLMFISPSLPTTSDHMRQIARRVLLSENSSAVSAQ
jgi:hypothetical protein